MAELTATTRAAVISRRERGRRAEQLRRSLPFPRAAWRRWMLRLLFMVPGFAVVALGVPGSLTAETPNAVLLARIAELEFTRADSLWLSQLYPHVSTLVGLIVQPLGASGLALAGVIAAGFLLQAVIQILAQRAVSIPFGTALMFALAATPLFFYLAQESLAAFLALTFFGLALADIQRFVTWGNTGSGFRAGLLLAASALSDPSGILLLLVALIAAPFLRSGRWTTRGLRAANSLVLAFPALGTLATVMLLNVVFFRVLWPVDVDAGLDRVPERLDQLEAIYTQTPASALLIAGPIIVAIVIAVVTRRLSAAAVALSAFALIHLGFLAGLVSAGAAGTTHLLTTLLAITLLPAGRTPLQNGLLAAVAVVQLALGWLISLDRPIVVEWMLALVAAIIRFATGAA